MKVIMSKQIYMQLFKLPQIAPYELGGFLGKREVICKFQLDFNTQQEKGSYNPNHSLFYKTISDWCKNGIQFCGIMHTHAENQNGISKEDEKFITAIMNENKRIFDDMLHFPIVIPQKEIIMFSAFWEKGHVKIKQSEIRLV